MGPPEPFQRPYFAAGDQVKVISGRFTGHLGTVESSVFQRTVDYTGDW